MTSLVIKLNNDTHNFDMADIRYATIAPAGEPHTLYILFKNGSESSYPLQDITSAVFDGKLIANGGLGYERMGHVELWRSQENLRVNLNRRLDMPLDGPVVICEDIPENILKPMAKQLQTTHAQS